MEVNVGLFYPKKNKVDQPQFVNLYLKNIFYVCNVSYSDL